MKLYDGGRAPNPRRTRIFLAEKGIKLPIETIDLSAMQHKSSDYAAVNPLMRVPALVLDDELRNRPFVAGDAFTVADVTGLVSIDFMKPAKLAVPDELEHLKRWHAEVSARPSASA